MTNTSRKQNTRRKQNTSKKRRRKNTYRGGDMIDIFRPKSVQEPTTSEDLLNIKREIEGTKIGNYESMIMEDIRNLSNLRTICVENCKSNLCKDPTACSQFNDMMNTKSDYEWGFLCKGINVTECKVYLRAYKKVESYVGYIKKLNDISQQLLTDYKNIEKQREHYI